MLNREAQEIHTANLSFDVSTDFRGLQKAVEQCEYFTSQYYINNTCVDLTVMDIFGVRQSLPRKKDRKGDRVFKIVREYRFMRTVEQHSKDFFDEISAADGPILMALKELVDKDDVFRKQGFSTAFTENVRYGYLLIVTFDIDEKEISEYKTVDSTALGITVSRLKRELMPSNPVYAAVNRGSYYNPFRNLLTPEYKMTRVFANYHDRIKEKFWFNLGDTPIEVEYTNKKELEEGIHIQAFKKSVETETAINSTVKIVKFDEAVNKNGFFTSARDAMLGSNTIRTDRERDQELKERTRLLEIRAVEAEERLAVAKKELTIAKQAADELSLQRQTTIAEIQHEHAIGIENKKQLTTETEYRLTRGKLGLVELQFDRDKVGFRNEVILADKKHQFEMLKVYGGAIKHAQDVELATVKHIGAMQELDRSLILSEAQHTQKLTMVEVDMVHTTTTNKRRLMEENTKLVTSVVGGLNTVGKLLL